MTLLVWILQIALSFLYLAGGGYKTFNSQQLLTGPVALPREAWIGLGVFEMIGAVLLIVPAVLSWQPGLAPLAATALAIETLVLAAIYASYSTRISMENPMPWAIVMGVLVAFVAWRTYGLYAGA